MTGAYRHWIGQILLWAAAMLMASCHDDTSDLNGLEPEIVTYKVAMVLREADGQGDENRRIADWYTDNMIEAQAGLPVQVRLEFEWYDENSADMSQLGQELAKRDDIFAVIGPYSSEKSLSMAYHCSFTKKCLLLPVVSSAEGVRAMAGQQFLWSLVESDITQCEVLLSTIFEDGYDKVSLIAHNGAYGQTFIDWFAYQATELGLEIGEIATYDEPQDLDPIVERIPGNSAVLCVTGGPEELVQIMNLKDRCGQSSTAYYFSDSALERTLLKGGFTGHARCTSFYADPASGFKIAYEERFGHSPFDVDAHLYDALLLAGYAAAYCASSPMADAYQAICDITTFKGRKVSKYVWEGNGMKEEFSQIAQGDELTIDIRGASSDLNFDERIKTSVLHSNYCVWNVWGRGDHCTISSYEYKSTDGSNRTNADLANWNWQTSNLQEFEDVGTTYHHPALTGQWALLVASSKGWLNYRHQADVLRMYQNLKKNGFDDDHIILITEDDLAQNEYNPAPGTVISPVGDNLYTDVKVDYRPSEIEMADLKDILLGRKSERLPYVVESDSAQNVFVFWSGHGSMKGEFVWLDRYDGISYYDVRDVLIEAANDMHYRKMLWMVEACYAESVMRAAEGLPDILCFTAANRYEESKADVYDINYRTYLTNRFTTTLIDTYSSDPAMPFRDLYYTLSRSTIASHVCLINAVNNDNLFKSDIMEFMQYQE